MTSSMRSNHSDVSRAHISETVPGRVEPISRFLKVPPKGASNTLRAGTEPARAREMARFHGFPDWFRFHETKWHGARRIGSSVPPPLARALAGKIMKAARLHRQPAEEVIEAWE